MQINLKILEPIKGKSHEVWSIAKMWRLKKRLLVAADYFRVLNLFQEVNSIRGIDKFDFDFYIELRDLREELEALRPIPHCSC